MKCYKCEKLGEYKTDNKKFCKYCFSDIIEKRIRKEIRIHDLIQKNDKILILDDNSIKSKTNIFFLEGLIKDPTIKVDIKKIKNFKINKNYDTKKKYTKIVFPWTLDDEITIYLKSFFEDFKTEFLHTKKIIKPLIGVTYDELSNYSKIKNIKGATSKPIAKDISLMIERLEKRYPGTKFGVLKTIRKLNT